MAERILGVVLAGGQSSRFGSDKALAELHGQTLLLRAIDMLSGWCDHVAVVGRETAPAPTLPDWPRPGMGPLGGIAAALRLARDEVFDVVLTCGVDSAELPENLAVLLHPAPAYLADQPVVGLWPTSAAQTIEAILLGDGKHSMRQFAEAIDARPVQLARKPANINTPADLAELETRNGL
jgi:molybdenum cofactor guanylyltransferase